MAIPIFDHKYCRELGDESVQELPITGFGNWVIRLDRTATFSTHDKIGSTYVYDFWKNSCANGKDPFLLKFHYMGVYDSYKVIFTTVPTRTEEHHASISFSVKILGTGDGTGSIRIRAKGDKAISFNRTVVEPTELYTLLFKMKSSTIPSQIATVKGYCTGSTDYPNNVTTMGTGFSTNKPNVWEDKQVSIEMPTSNHNTLDVVINMEAENAKGDIWFDDFKLVKGVHTPPPAKKASFDKGGSVKISELGAFNVDGADIFPFYIYGTSTQPTWETRYEAQGFDGLMWSHDIASAKKAVDKGMRFGIEMSYWVVKKQYTPKLKPADLATFLQQLKDEGIFDKCTFYYWDNEFYHHEPYLDDILDAIKSVDTKAEIPHYMLSGNYGLANWYDFVNVMGTYVARDDFPMLSVPSSYHGRPMPTDLIHMNEIALAPATIAQINEGVNENFAAILFAAIANGAKGAGYWRDGSDGTRNLDISNQIWYPQMPTIRANIETLLQKGVIQAPNITAFRASTQDRHHYVGTKVVNNTDGFVILANTKTTDAIITVQLEGYPSVIDDVKNTLTGQSVEFTQNTITVPLLKHGYIVLELITNGAKVNIGDKQAEPIDNIFNDTFNNTLDSSLYWDLYSGAEIDTKESSISNDVDTSVVSSDTKFLN